MLPQAVRVCGKCGSGLLRVLLWGPPPHAVGVPESDLKCAVPSMRGWAHDPGWPSTGDIFPPDQSDGSLVPAWSVCCAGSEALLPWARELGPRVDSSHCPEQRRRHEESTAKRWGDVEKERGTMKLAMLFETLDPAMLEARRLFNVSGP